MLAPIQRDLKIRGYGLIVVGVARAVG